MKYTKIGYNKLQLKNNNFNVALYLHLEKQQPSFNQKKHHFHKLNVM